MLGPACPNLPSLTPAIKEYIDQKIPPQSLTEGDRLNKLKTRIATIGSRIAEVQRLNTKATSFESKQKHVEDLLKEIRESQLKLNEFRRLNELQSVKSGLPTKCAG